MLRQQNVLQNLIIVLQVILIFFCFVDLSGLPQWVLFTGRLHPVVLHLPITLTLLLIPASLIVQHHPENKLLKDYTDALIHYNALLATLTALAGFLLAANGGYEKDLLSNHKWLGVGVAFISHGLIYLNKLKIKFILWNGAVITSALLILFGSHLGGSLTHGEDFLAFTSEKKQSILIPSITENTTILQGAIQPVLNAKCISCHNDQKAKGGLNMKDINSMLKGGKTGALWVSGDPEKSLMIERMLLDLDDKNHMPPKGKAQLSSVEIAIFKEWIHKGASPKLTFHALADQDTLRKLITKLIESLPKAETIKEYNFKSASSKTIEKLNNPFRHIYSFANNSPALIVEFYLKEKYGHASLQELKDISDQIIQLSLAGMPADDQSFDIISGFSHLEKLNLNATSITGKGIDKLRSCKQLEQVSVANTSLGYDEISSLASIPSIKKLFVWKTKLKIEEIESLRKKFPKIQWDNGYIPDKNELLKLTPPILDDLEKRIYGPDELIRLKHPMPGVKIRYTTDGSNPDSASSTLYTEPIKVLGLMRLRAIATSDGWLTSDTTDNSFFQRSFKPDSAILLHQPDPKYSALGAKSLTDELKGNSPNLSVNWLGYKDSTFKAGFYFYQDKEMKEIIVSVVENIDQYVFPPVKITVKGGDSPKKMTILGTVMPEQPTKNGRKHIIPVHIPISPKKFRYIEIEAIPVAKMPKWHPGAGDKGWVFVDEVFFY